jgi:hypothetical protein
MDLKFLRNYDRQAAKGVSSNPHDCDAGFFIVQNEIGG